MTFPILSRATGRFYLKTKILLQISIPYDPYIRTDNWNQCMKISRMPNEWNDINKQWNEWKLILITCGSGMNGMMLITSEINGMDWWNAWT